jgi:hypothetical protein
MTKAGTRGAGYAPRDVKLLLNMMKEHLPMSNQDDDADINDTTMFP